MTRTMVFLGGTGQMVLHYLIQLYLVGIIKEPFRKKRRKTGRSHITTWATFSSGKLKHSSSKAINNHRRNIRMHLSTTFRPSICDLPISMQNGIYS